MTNGESELAEKAEGQESAIVIDEIGGSFSDMASAGQNFRFVLGGLSRCSNVPFPA